MKITDLNTNNSEIIVIFTGYMFGIWTFNDVVEGLKDYRIIVIEDIGAAFGESKGGSYTEAIKDIAHYLEAQDITRFHLVGHSMGGFLAQKFALKHANYLLSLSLLGSCHIADFQQSHRVNALPALDPLFDLDPNSFFKFTTHNIFSGEFLKDSNSLDKLRQDFDQNLPCREKCRSQLYMLQELYEADEDTQKMSVPCLVIYGEHDEIIPRDWVVELHKHCQEQPHFQGLNSSHMFMYENPQETLQALTHWFISHQ